MMRWWFSESNAKCSFTGALSSRNASERDFCLHCLQLSLQQPDICCLRGLQSGRELPRLLTGTRLFLASEGQWACTHTHTHTQRSYQFPLCFSVSVHIYCYSATESLLSGVFDAFHSHRELDMNPVRRMKSFTFELLWLENLACRSCRTSFVLNIKVWKCHQKL